MKGVDPTRLEIFKNLFHSVAEEMGAGLRRSAFSPNIKERRDYSCAVYNSEGEVLAMGDHMPVHLGSMPASVAAARAAFSLERGDIAVLNDPFAGGTHLPDLTMVTGVFLGGKKQASFYVANRAHHSDIGGALAGSMGPAREIFQEGLRIPPVKIYRRGQVQRDVWAMILANVRTPAEREGDLAAQVAACKIGERRLLEIVNKYGDDEVQRFGKHLLDYSNAMMVAALRQLKSGKYSADDFMDGDGVHPGRLRIRVRMKIARGRVEVDFTGSSPQCAGNVNAVEAVAQSAVYYVFRCLLEENVPATSGLMRPIRVIAPAGTIVNVVSPAAVAGGNTETSQRMVDALLRTLAKVAPSRIPAASQGTMNNLTLGGFDPRNKNRPFAYYETISGGMGARPGCDGISAVHTHMTNSWNTPIEVFEQTYPVRVQKYAVRENSGGAGRYRGGDGVIREIELLTEMQVGLLTERREIAPYGLAGGADGKAGKNLMIQNGKKRALPGKCAFLAAAGTRVRIETPGGGGWGKVRRKRS